MTAVDDLDRFEAYIRSAEDPVALDAALEAAQRLAAQTWAPLPHQRPPEGKWSKWVSLGGRGAGKTAAVVAWLNDHMEGPPCDMRVPGGHRGGIIAPTFGDAVDAVVNGPSGLRALNPDVSVATERGGITVCRWPNGARARLFGAHTLDDVDRLRAGGNRSLLAGTLIATARGEVPIETVTTDDLVWTEAGLRPVLAVWDHGMRPIWRITTEAGRILHLTPDHEVWVDGRWIAAEQVAVGDRLSAWNGGVTAGSSCRTATGLGAPSAARSSFIERSTRPFTARSRRGGTSTIATATSSTTEARTSSLSTLRRTRPVIRRGETGMPLVLALPRSRLGRAPRAGRSSVGIELPASALVRAGELLNVGRLRLAACGHVSCAVALSSAPLARPPSLARDRVATISPGNVEGPVWDLTVATEHDFFADGILVSNCADAWEELAAWRQLGDAIANAEMGLRLGPNPQIAASTTPRNRAEIRALKQQADAWPTLALVDLVRAMFGAASMLNRSDRVALTHATTADNPHLPSDVRGDLFARYGGSRLGKQELEGELLTDVGTMFSRAWFRLIDALPAGRRPRVRYWDLAATVPSPANEDPDWTAGALVEMDRATRTFYVLDVERFRASPGEVAQRVEGIARIDGPDVAVVVEQDPGQAGKDQVAQYKERLRHTARVHGERPTGSKALRALLTATAAEAGRVHLLRGDWNLSFLDEHEEFTDDDSHRHDDITDATSGALAVLERGLGGGMSAGTSAAAMTHGRVLRNGGR